MAKVKGTDVEGKVVTLERSQPAQLSLFRTFVPSNDKYSNTIELYDAVPKYFASAKHMQALREGGKYLPILERSFFHRGERYTVKIRPARLRDIRGNEKEYYPSEREELVEEALKKIACDQLNGVYLDDSAGVQFTLYELQQELKKRGHSIHLRSLIEALTLCNLVNISIEKEEYKSLMKSAIFPTLLLTDRQQWLSNPRQARCYVQFNPLITHSINRLTYRQFDYCTFMEHKRQLTRWLHKRLSHNYTQASLTTPYHITMTTIIRDSGLVNSVRVSQNVQYIDACLEELKEREVLALIAKDVRRGPRNRIEEVKYTLTPDFTFVDEMKCANRRKSILLQKMENTGTRLSKE